MGFCFFCDFFQFFRGQLGEFMAGHGIPAGGTHDGVGFGIVHGAADHTGPTGQTRQGPDFTPVTAGFFDGADHSHFFGVIKK